MRRSPLLCAFLVVSLPGCAPASAKVFLRVSPSSLAPTARTGIQDLVLLWPVRDRSLLGKFTSEGYRVFLQCESKDLSSVAVAAEQSGVAGIVVSGSRSSSAEVLRPLLAAHAKLAFRFLASGGRQPQMRGRLVVERDGVLQVSSPSTQPWLDSNLAVVRLAQGLDPLAFPVIYDFHWEPAETPRDAWHPDAEAYALAIAEADAARSDIIVDLPDRLQQALAAEDPQAWSLWSTLKPYLDFSSRATSGRMQPVVNLSAIVDDARSSYEAINLMARHNLAFETVRPRDLTAARLENWNSVVVLCPLDREELALVRDFAAQGGIVIFVNSHDEFPWHSNPAVRREADSTSYTIGRGQIVELAKPVIDPESFARDVRRLIGSERSALALWNSLTTLVTGYRDEAHGEDILYLVNYSDQPDNVQVRVRGRFTRARLESPEGPCCTSLPFVERGGFTEFTVPALHITARVHLESSREKSNAP